MLLTGHSAPLLVRSVEAKVSSGKNENECSEQLKITIKKRSDENDLEQYSKAHSKNQSAGAGVRVGRRRRAYLAAKRESSTSNPDGAVRIPGK